MPLGVAIGALVASALVGRADGFTGGCAPLGLSSARLRSPRAAGPALANVAMLAKERKRRLPFDGLPFTLFKGDQAATESLSSSAQTLSLSVSDQRRDEIEACLEQYNAVLLPPTPPYSPLTSFRLASTCLPPPCFRLPPLSRLHPLAPQVYTILWEKEGDGPFRVQGEYTTEARRRFERCLPALRVRRPERCGTSAALLTCRCAWRCALQSVAQGARRRQDVCVGVCKNRMPRHPHALPAGRLRLLGPGVG